MASSFPLPHRQRQRARGQPCPLAAPQTGPAPVLDVVIPVHNEEADLEASVRRLDAYLTAHLPYEARITIADNASTDATWEIAQRLAVELPRVRALRLERKGRGLALRSAWSRSDAAILAYMDVDLSTDLNALLPLVAPLLSGHSHLAVGRRLGSGARVVRSPRREILSRGYNLLLRLALGACFRDAQCGFKALRADVARRLLPAVEDEGWFFDTELLTLAQRAGLRIYEVPVDWIEDQDSRVDLLPTILEDLRGIWRLWRRRQVGLPPKATAGRGLVPTDLARQLVRFSAIGILSTGAYFGIYWLLRDLISAPLANLLSLLITALANTAANRRLTFGVRGRRALARDHTGGLLALGVAIAITTAALAALHAARPDASRLLELAVLGVGNLVATAVRFLLLRAWIYRPHRLTPLPPLRPKEGTSP
jgi:putative flippase GtrA